MPARTTKTDHTTKTAPTHLGVRVVDADAMAALAPKRETPSPLLPHVQTALQAAIDGKGGGVLIGYGDDYPRTTVLEHVRKAVRQLGSDVPPNLKYRTFDKADHVDPDGTPWPHIGVKFVPRPAPKAKKTAE